MEIRDMPRPHGERMVECVACGRRYAGVDLIGKRCPHCEEELAPSPRVEGKPLPDVPVVEVYRAPDELAAETIQEYLENNGVKVAFRSAFPSQVFPFTIDGMSEVALLAIEPEAERARQLINEYLESEPEVAQAMDEMAEPDEEDEEQR